MISSNDRFGDIDTLIVGRGGGSAEDLWAFNDEILARTIYNCTVPVISAVGHEIDFSISDFVADRRAETPTAAAEMAVPDIREIRYNLEKYKTDLLSSLSAKVKSDGLMMENCMLEMRNAINKRLSEYIHRLERMRLLLDENNPSSVLKKGYSMVTDMSGKVISSVSDVKEGEKYALTMKDGRIIFAACDTEVEKNAVQV